MKMCINYKTRPEATLKRHAWASEVAQQVKSLAAEPDHMSWIPGTTHHRKRELTSPVLSSDFHVHSMAHLCLPHTP